ncbi:MAG: hypothetical protein IIC84_08750 [Chloroflexi bacterium]|nr:hypothetical protein [Chloroflexota bacterium]
MDDRIVIGSPPAVISLTREEKNRGLESIKHARLLRKAMLKRRKGKLVPDSTPLIRQSRAQE